MFGAAILAYKQVRVFEMLPIQFLIYKIKASFVPNSKPYNTTFSAILHVSALFLVFFLDNKKVYKVYISA